MGFREQVRTLFLIVNDLEDTVPTYTVQTEEFVTMLVFDSERMTDLRMGAKCLDEVIKNQVQAIEDAERAERQSIAANETAAESEVRLSKAGYRSGKTLISHSQVVNAILDDRQRVAARVKREKLARECGTAQAESDNPEPPAEEMSNLKIKTL